MLYSRTERIIKLKQFFQEQSTWVGEIVYQIHLGSLQISKPMANRRWSLSLGPGWDWLSRSLKNTRKAFLSDLNYCNFIDFKTFRFLPYSSLCSRQTKAEIQGQKVIPAHTIAGVRHAKSIQKRGPGSSLTSPPIVTENGRVILTWKNKLKCEILGTRVVEETFLYTLHFADDQVVIAQDKDDAEYACKNLKRGIPGLGPDNEFEQDELSLRRRTSRGLTGRQW